MTPKTITYYDYSDLKAKLIELGAADDYLLGHVIITIAEANNGAIMYMFLRDYDNDYVYSQFDNNEHDAVAKVLDAMNHLADELDEDGIYVSFSW